eukprot:gene7416-5222_t
MLQSSKANGRIKISQSQVKIHSENSLVLFMFQFFTLNFELHGRQHTLKLSAPFSFTPFPCCLHSLWVSAFAIPSSFLIYIYIYIYIYNFSSCCVMAYSCPARKTKTNKKEKQNTKRTRSNKNLCVACVTCLSYQPLLSTISFDTQGPTPTAALHLCSAVSPLGIDCCSCTISHLSCFSLFHIKAFTISVYLFLMSFLLEPVTVEAGLAILSNRHLNRGTAFTEEQRRELKLVGLLPPRVETLEQQVERVWNQLCRYEKPINRYQHLASIHSTNTTLYYAVIMAHLEDLLPIIYTPTVGEACQNFSNYYIRERGVYLHRGIRGSFKEALENRRRNNVRVIVITDGSRILGLGDLGVNGVGISIGKCSLYVAGAGIHPSLVCPVVLDAGVNTERYLTDPQYFGTREKRFEDTEFYSMLDEFMEAAKVVWPSAVVQFEDFSNNHCFDMLERYQSKYRCFNDDIQGTGAVIAAGFLNAMRISGVSPLQQRTVVFGAGSAAVGVAKNIAQLAARLHKGVTYEDMLKTFYLVDTKGLVTTTRGDKLQAHKVLLAHTDVSAEDSAKLKTLEDVVDFVKPTALLGLGGVGPVFTEKIVKKCIPADAYKWTDGKALIASGSPFPACTVNGKTLKPSQGNNLYVFPGIGLGSGLAQPATIPDEVLVAASASLCTPPLDQIHKISANIAADVILEAQRLNVDGDKSLPTNRDEILAVVRKAQWMPKYSPELDFEALLCFFFLYSVLDFVGFFVVPVMLFSLWIALLLRCRIVVPLCHCVRIWVNRIEMVNALRCRQMSFFCYASGSSLWIRCSNAKEVRVNAYRKKRMKSKRKEKKRVSIAYIYMYYIYYILWQFIHLPVGRSRSSPRPNFTIHSISVPILYLFIVISFFLFVSASWGFFHLGRDDTISKMLLPTNDGLCCGTLFIYTNTHIYCHYFDLFMFSCVITSFIFIFTDIFINRSYRPPTHPSRISTMQVPRYTAYTYFLLLFLFLLLLSARKKTQIRYGDPSPPLSPQPFPLVPLVIIRELLPCYDSPSEPPWRTPVGYSLFLYTYIYIFLYIVFIIYYRYIKLLRGQIPITRNRITIINKKKRLEVFCCFLLTSQRFSIE